MTTRITVAHNEFRLAGTRDALDNGAGNATIELWEGTRPASLTSDADPHWSKVALLLNMEGANGSTTFADTSGSPKTVTPLGGASLTSAGAIFGTASFLADASNSQALSVANSAGFNPGAGDWTLEMRYRPSSVGQAQSLFGKASGTGFYPFNLRLEANGKFQGYATDGTTSYSTGGAAGPIAQVGTTYALELVRHGGNLSLFVDGQPAGTHSGLASSSMFFDTSPICVGGYSVGYLTNSANGMIDAVRLTIGAARHTAAFTPDASAPVPGIAGVGTLVSVLTLTKPCGSVAAGTLSPTTVSDATAVAAGTPNYALWKDGNGTVVMDTGAGSLVSAEEVKISPATVAAGATVHLVSAALG